jgi:hypothetical protein
MTVLYVDADACPVKDEAVRVAERHGVKVFIVSNGGIRPRPEPLVEMVIVGGGFDAADDWIAERAGPGDVVVTADIPLAARAVAKGARVLKPNGEAVTGTNAGQALAMRDLMTGGPPPFSRRDRSLFLDALETTLRAARGD